MKDAALEPGIIRAWWRRWPNANVGIVTGKESDLVALDVDARYQGEESLAALEAMYDRLPGTLTARTGGGGRHLFFRHPGGSVHNIARLFGLEGLDVRGDGGYIVAPPSRHLSGQYYAWQDEARPLAELPEWLSSLLARHTDPNRQGVRTYPQAPPGEAEPFWLSQALERARPGNRNVTGYWLACHLRDDGVSREAARAVLLRYAAQVVAGDHPYHAREALASLRSAYRHLVPEPTLRT